MELKFFLAFPPLISCILIFALGVFVVSQNIGARVNRLFGALCFFLALYNFGVFFMYSYNAGAAAAAIAASCAPAAIIGILPDFTLAFLGYNSSKPYFTFMTRAVAYSAALLFITLCIKGMVITGVYKTSLGYVGSIGPAFGCYSAALLISGAICGYLFYYAHKNSNCEEFKVKIRHFLLGAAVCLTLGFVDIFKKIMDVRYNFSLFEYGIMFFCFLTAYAIIKHRFLHIELVVKKGVLYSLLMIITALFVIVASAAFEQFTQNLIDSSYFIVNLLNALMVAAFFEPLKEFLRRLLNKYFFPRLVDIKIDELLMKNAAILDIIAAGKLEELKLLKSKIEEVIEASEKQ